MFRTSFIRQHGLAYDANLPRAEDYRLFVEMMRQGATFYGVQEELLLYRRHANNITKDINGLDKEKNTVREAILPIYYPQLTGMDCRILIKGMSDKVKITQQEANIFVATVDKANKETQSYGGEDREELRKIMNFYRQRMIKLVGNK